MITSPRLVDQQLKQLTRRFDNMLARGTISEVQDNKLQHVSVRLMADEMPTAVEQFQSYGLTARPHAGAEVLVSFMHGNRDHGVVIAFDDRRYRLQGLKDGEVALYDDQGQKVHFKRDAVWVETTKKVVAKAPKVLIGEDNDALPRVLTEAGPSSVLRAKV